MFTRQISSEKVTSPPRDGFIINTETDGSSDTTPSNSADVRSNVPLTLPSSDETTNLDWSTFCTKIVIEAQCKSGTIPMAWDTNGVRAICHFFNISSASVDEVPPVLQGSWLQA